MLHWLRKVRVSIEGGPRINPGGLDGPQIRVQFKVSKTISGSPNQIEVKLFNLSKSSRNSIGKEFQGLTLEAGYLPPQGGGNVGIIGKGRIRDVESERVGPDIITTIYCGDGDKAFRKATISETIQKGTPIPDVVERIFEDLQKQGIGRGEWKFPDDIRTLKRPYSMCGACVRELNTLGRGNGFYWSIQNEVLEIIPSDGFLSGTLRINEDTGMIGSPTVTDNGVKVSAQLNPDARPNRLFQYQSEFASGMARASTVDFDGDNQEGDFKMTLHGESASGSKVDEGVR
ncbi:phage protein [Roseibium alexandrii]|uniref:Uncharacterized protein n=1 Tax=Roseibium alexandrii TaxID=388408 RepID=A0A0M6ZXU6_9HYPH|nr:hypothetical protein [Roseibium alexandrii]CTQ67107.1 hypothetical protein LAX5112_01215 [Roseibium alexandrii]